MVEEQQKILDSLTTLVKCYDMLKQELWVASSSWKLKNMSWNSKVQFRIQELRAQIHEFKFTNYEFNFARYEIKSTS